MAASSQLSLDQILFTDPKEQLVTSGYNGYHYYPNVKLNILKRIYFSI